MVLAEVVSAAVPFRPFLRARAAGLHYDIAVDYIAAVVDSFQIFVDHWPFDEFLGEKTSRE